MTEDVGRAGKLYLEDLHVGQIFHSSSATVDMARMIAFAEEFDPQAFHVGIDSEALDGLAASGWLTASITHSLLVRDGFPVASGFVGISVEVTWPKPTRAGDRLSVRTQINDLRRLKSKPNRGIVSIRSETFNDRGDIVQIQDAKVIVTAANLMDLNPVAPTTDRAGVGGEALHSPADRRMAPRLDYFDVLIVGAGHAGAQAAIALRQAKFAGSIAIIGDEPELPYERPPLSKEYLAGERPFERLLIRPAKFWQEREIVMLSGQRVVAVDPLNHEVTTRSGEVLRYGSLVWAAGGQARRLACRGHDLSGVHTVRSRADVDRMITELPSVTKVVVIGGGFIGLEAAAVLIKLDKRVTVLEALDRLLARVAGEPLSRFYEAEHRAHGVDVRLGITVDCVEETDGAVSGVRLSDGSVLRCEMVIVGIGIVPAVEPLLAAGAEGGNGVLVDAQCRTSLPDIFAIGDCAAHANAYAGGGTVRLESVQNANDQAATVAKTITGLSEPYNAVPWFWSNQYDLKLQTVGLSLGHDAAVLRGDPAARSFSVIYLKDGHVIALDCVNAAKDYVQGRTLVAARARIEPAKLSNATLSLKEVAAEAATVR